MKKTIIIFLMLVFIFAQAVSADTIYLKNGGKIKGTVVDESRVSMTIDIGGGTVVQNKKDVVKIEKGNREDAWSPKTSYNYGIKNADRKHVEAPPAKSKFSEIVEGIGNFIGSLVRLDFLKRS